MNLSLGIDIGSSSTKAAALDEHGTLLGTRQVHADDPRTSAYGVLGRFLDQQGASFDDVEKIVLTGLGSTYFHENIFGIPTIHALELDAIGHGGPSMNERGGRFPATVRSDDADAVILQEDIGKIIDQEAVTIRLMKMVCLDRGSSETAGNRAHLHISIYFRRFHRTQRLEALNTPFLLRAACLCAAPDPRQLRPQDILAFLLRAHRHRLALCL